MSKIIKLQSSNVKRLQAVEITPQGNVVVIGGRNGQGKTSVLDSIEYALGGDPEAKMPVRRGEEKARVVVDLGDLVVRRTFTASGGTSLVVTDSDGKKQASPQAILDRMVGKLTFDPLAFSRQKPPQQAETLRALVGLDFQAQDGERTKLYDERTAVNREVKTVEMRISGMPKHEAPADEVSTAAILDEQRAAVEQNAANAKLDDAAAKAAAQLKAAKGDLTEIDEDIFKAENAIKDLQTKLGRLKEERPASAQQVPKLEQALEAATKAVADAKFVPLEQFGQRLKDVEATNAKVRANKQRAELVRGLRLKQIEAEELSDKIERVDSEKRRAITEAKYPVPGLSFDAAGGVLMNGIPFEQCSGAEQLRVSVAVGLALNPKLRVLLIRDGSLLDEDSLALLVAQAKEADAQVWIEMVTADAESAIIIEDGLVAEAKAVEAPKPQTQEALL